MALQRCPALRARTFDHVASCAVLDTDVRARRRTDLKKDLLVADAPISERFRCHSDILPLNRTGQPRHGVIARGSRFYFSPR
eukprot:6873797-Prymnesium_polylepis.1